MLRALIIAAAWAAAVAVAVLAVKLGHTGWWVGSAVLAALAGLGTWDLVQKSHSILRAFPILGHARWIAERIRPEIYQYFVESNTDGAPFDRETRDAIYRRAKGTKGDEPFGTERDVTAVGYEFLRHSMRARIATDLSPRIRLNVSAMSFGALSGNAIEALNGGAAKGGFAHDTGEGAISPYHLKHGGDLIWEIGSGYFGCRTPDGNFDAEKFRDKAALPTVKAISIKLSQGAKPGLGGVLPGAKVTPEIAETRGVPVGQTVVSPPEFLSMCKAMLQSGITPDFIIIDGSEGGTGAAPQEFVDHVGMPLTEGLMLAQNCLVGTGLREHLKIGASGKITSGFDIVKRIIQGADFTLSARGMMFAVGCIQAMKCHTNHCPTGVATQDPGLARALHVPDKIDRAANFQQAVVASAAQMVASMGLESFSELTPSMLNRRIDSAHNRTYAEIYEWLMPGELLECPPEAWLSDWIEASAEEFV
jgi:glutamate synthase domain-containing protein 2